MVDMNKYQIEAVKQNRQIKDVLKSASAELSAKRTEIEEEIGAVNKSAEEGLRRKRQTNRNVLLANILVPIAGIVLFIFIDYQWAESMNNQLRENRSITYFMPSFGNEIRNMHKTGQQWIIWICVTITGIALIVANVRIALKKPTAEMQKAISTRDKLRLTLTQISQEIEELDDIVSTSEKAQ